MASGEKTDYSGRTVDLLLLKTVLGVPAINQRVSIDVSNVSGVPMIAAGAEKLVQRFALAFINAAGSTRFRPDHGTDMIPSVGNGMVYDMSSLEVTAAEANLLARTQIMKGDEGEDTPDDERLVDSEIIDLEFSRERSLARVSIRLATAAGESYTYIIPVAVGVHA